MMKININTTGDKREVMKASNATKTYKDVKNQPLIINAIVQYEDEDTDPVSGVVETKVVSVVRTVEGEYIGSASDTIKRSINVLNATYEQSEIEAGIEIMVKAGQSKGGREFLFIDLV